MNMKKIIAATLTSVMALSSVAFAATTPADVENRQPVWTFEEPVLLTTKDEVKAASTAKFSVQQYDPDTYDYYKLVYKLTNLGDLKNEYWEDVVGIYSITLGMKTSSIVKGGAAAFDNAKTAIGQSAQVGQTEWFNITFEAAGGVENPYPAMNEDGEQIQVDDGTITLTSAVAVAKGATVTVNEFQGKVSYVTDGSVETGVTNIVLPTSLTIGKTVEEDKPVVFTADLKENTANGYIWALTFTQSADKLATFTAKFEADGVEPAERAIKDASALATVLAGKTAPIVLNVGLKTTKTLTKATFTADDAVETTEACVFEAPLSK